MQCKHESENSKVAEPCKKGHTFCMEDECPDYEPAETTLQD